MQLAPLICVHDVEASSRWYQRLLSCSSGHGGDEYERLTFDGRLVQNGNWEYWLRDPDGYTVVLTSPLP